MGTKKLASNKGFALAGIPCFASTSVLKIATFAKPAARCSHTYKIIAPRHKTLTKTV
jgi:hypothetical protein